MATRYQALLEERATLVAEGEAVFAAAEAASRDLTADERTRDDAIQARLSGIADSFVLEERRRERERSVAAAVDAVSRPTSRVTNVHDRAEDEPWGARTGHPFGEQLQAVYRAAIPGGDRDVRLYRAASPGLGMNESVGSDGGFAVEEDTQKGILQRMYSMGEILTRVKHIPLSSGANSLELNAINETSRATGSRLGGVQGYWMDEGGAITPTRPKFKQLNWKLKKLAALGYATDELLADAAALEMVMTEGFSDELRFQAEDALYEGTGAGQPLGIINSPALVTVAKATGQAAATIIYENILGMWSRCWGASRRNSVWMINQDCEPQLNSMALVIGVGGVPVYLPAGGLAGSPFATLFGRPVVPVEYASTMGTVGDIALVDWSQYAVIEKDSIQQASSMHVAFLTDEMAFRCIYRVDGRPTWHSALTPFKGTNTLAPYVVLATRS